MTTTPRRAAAIGLAFFALGASAAAVEPGAKQEPLGEGWSRNSVNSAIFRRSSIVSDDRRQVASYYDAQGRVVLAQRDRGDDAWRVVTTELTGDPSDAHNVISLGLDGAGRLHASWDHHGHPLRYAVETTPGGLDLKKLPSMTEAGERVVTYPQFFRLPDGDLLFFFRSGASGRGDLVVNRLDARAGNWTRLHDSLLGGEGRRNAYWQAAVDDRGAIHLSWVWRESGAVETNHDLLYARSDDGGLTWRRSNGERYTLPITADTAEVAAAIPQGSDLINQTSMDVDRDGRPWIASYWRPAGAAAPQYQIVRHTAEGWRVTRPFERRLDFRLAGGGSLRIPMSRPLLLIDRPGDRGVVVFRDAERGDTVSVAVCDDLREGA